jgi:hypothetical protein
MSPEEGTIEFWYKPHFNQNDSSAILFLFGLKDRIDDPLNVYGEADSRNFFNFEAGWGGWSGRKFWYFLFRERDSANAVISSLRIQTPNENEPDRIYFNAEEWLHFGFVWKHDGIAEMGGKTMVLFIDGVEVASDIEKFYPQHPFPRYFIIGGIPGCAFTPNSPMKCYSGASGDIDNLKVWSYAKTDFSDRFDEIPAPPDLEDRVEELELQLEALTQTVMDLQVDLEEHSHTYLTGKGKGHNKKEAKTGPATFPGAP